MDIVIWGIGELGKCTYKLLNRSNSHIIAFVDSNTTFVGKNIEGIPITSYEQLKEMSDTKKVTVLLTLKNSYSIITVLKMLENCNIEDIGIKATDFNKKSNNSNRFKRRNYMVKKKWKKI